MEDIVLIGFGGHAKSVADTIETQGKYRIVGFTDQDLGKTYKNYKTIGTDEALADLFRQGVKNAFITIGYMGDSTLRKRLYLKLKEIGYQVPAIIDDTAVLAEDARIGEGTYIGKRAVVNANAVVGDMCIINTGAVVEHDCRIGSFSHVAVGAVVCGMAQIGQEVLIGANATVLQCVKIGKGAKVGAGTVALKDVPSCETVCGIWKGRKSKEGL